MKDALALGLAVLTLAGCAAESGDYNYVTHTWSSNRGIQVQDPVSHRSVEKKSAVTRQYAGETYYFENEQNAKVFDSNPWAYMYVDDMEARANGTSSY